MTLASLLPCRCGAPAVEQIRGEMGPGDYWQDRQEPGVSFPWGNINSASVRVPFHTLVEQPDENNKDDLRIACTRCSNNTGWSRSYKASVEVWNSKCAV